MIPIKIQCGCGQKYAFDVEPVHGRMATAVACPVCGVDGTGTANQMIAQVLAAQAPPPVVRMVAPHATAPTPAAVQTPPPLAARPIAVAAPPKSSGEYSLGMGILGAFIGALVGAGAMYGFYAWAGFRFPLLGVGIGCLTGLGAKLMSRGTDNTLGVIAGVVSLITVVGTLYLMYGEFPIMSIISVAVSVSFAYRIASG